ncbi:MAG: transporter substrate-binding domain-containing protein [Candidatus Firestonebacteria bacterium]|nr:transporter substrate-binding domain-containing protein [Candidatus Firestonebacteria bacterium]
MKPAGVRWAERALFFCFLVCGLLTCAGAEETPARLRVGGSDAFAPYAFLDTNGTYTGFSVDLLQALGQNLGIESVLFYPATADENWRALAENRLDCLQGIRESLELTGHYLWIGPYLETVSRIFVLAGRFDISRVQDLDGRHVVVLKDDAAREILSRRPRVKVSAVDSPEQGVALLQSGRADAFVGERLTTLRYLSERRLQTRLKMVGPDVARARFGLVVRSERAELGRNLALGLKALERSGERNRLFRQWFGEDVLPQIPLSRRVIRWVFVFVGGSLLVAMIVLGWNLLLQRELELKAVVIEKSRLNQTIAEEKKRFEAVVQSMTEGLMLVDPQGRIAYVNARGALYLGGQDPVWLGKPLSALRDYLLGVVQDPELFRARFEHAESQPGRPALLEYQIVTTRRTDMHLKIFPVRDPGGEFAGRGVLIEDMTHEREIDRIKSEFVSVASHELRTPMTSILGFSEIMLTQALPEDLSRRYTEQIHKEAGRLTRVLNDMLDLNYLESGEGRLAKQPLSLSALVQEVVAAFHAQGKQQREIVVAQSAPVETITGDRDKLAQVLWNLLSNADKYSPPEQTVRIELAQHAVLSPAWGLSAEEAEGLVPAVEMRVVNFGPGIPTDQLIPIFSPFHRVETAVHTIRGTGLGLAIVKRIVEAHGGRVWAQSEMGKQTVFTVLLPVISHPAY